MKHMLMQTNSAADPTTAQKWTPEDRQNGWPHMRQIWQELTDAGELIATRPLAGPQTAKLVISDGVDAPVVTDGPFQEMKEFLAGFRIIDVDSEERAIDIAARTSAAPGAGGRPSRYPIEVRAVMSPPDPEQ